MARPLLTVRALNRATLARQFLLERSTMSVESAIEHLVGLQAQTPHTAYTGLWTRLQGFDPEALSVLLTERRVVRMALMRGTIHMVTARDAWALRPLVQPVLDRVQKNQFGKPLAGLDSDEIVAVGRAFVDGSPRTFRSLGDHLLTRWPERDRFALEQAIRTGVPLVQVPPRGLWGRSGPIAHTSIEAWLGPHPPETMTLDTMIRRYLAAFGPASVMDAQAWCGLTRLGEVFERLRADLLTFTDERGRELFDLPHAPRPDPRTPAPVRFLYDFENMLLSYADRSRAIPPALTRAIDTRTQESLSTFTVDGFAAGIWRVDRDRRSATLVVTPVEAIPRAVRSALVEEGARLLVFLAADAPDRDVRVAQPLT
ncbi:MAG: winged helix DNA-binding domain-containing protein [Chloroflexota bacterium]